jgi:hypothetical protein
VNILKELGEGGLLLGRALEQQQHALRRKGIRDRALVVARPGERMDVAGEGEALTVVDGSGDAGPWERLGQGGIPGDHGTKNQN